mgnify:CR=1 FL=1
MRPELKEYKFDSMLLSTFRDSSTRYMSECNLFLITRQDRITRVRSRSGLHNVKLSCRAVGGDTFVT